MGARDVTFRVLVAILALVGVVALLLAAGGYLYLTDAKLEAKVTDRSGQCPPGEVEVTPSILPFVHHRAAVPCNAWSFVCVGHDVDFRVRSREYTVREGDRVVYDSASGSTDTFGLLRCGASNTGGGLLG